MMASSSANVVNVGPQVFINFRGEVRKSFVSHLVRALRRNGINAYIDSNELAGENLDVLFRRIQESTVALAILSTKYTESHWCLRELVKIIECVDRRRTLWVIPIFYKLGTDTVERLDGKFGVQMWDLWREARHARDGRILEWNAALQALVEKFALVLESSGDEVAFVKEIIEEVKNALTKDLSEREGTYPKPDKSSNRALNILKPGGQRLEQLEEKLHMECNDDNDTRVVGIVGMVGIGKTYLAEKLYEKLTAKIRHHVFIDVVKESKGQELYWLQKKVATGLLKQDINANGSPLEVLKNRLLKKKVAVVLDGVSDKKQIDEVLRNRDWIKKGSRIVITSRDKSLLKELACDIYEVPGLNYREGLELFGAQICSTHHLEGNFKEMSRKFLDYAEGNPLALKVYGEELRGKEEDQWEETLGTLTKTLATKMKEALKISYDELNNQQKHAFLEITCFCRSQDEDYVRTLLDSFDHESGNSGSEINDLADKFLIHISNARVEMRDLLFTMGMDLLETGKEKYWLCPSKFAESTDSLMEKEGKEEVRGIVIDMSKMEEKPLDDQAFVGMSNLRYLKVYNSTDPGHVEAECKLNLPYGLKFPEDNVLKYIYWIRFPAEELPSNFEPKNLTDLSLPYSKITHVWRNTKVAPKLKWVDLSHSSKLTSLSSLSEAPNLLRLNLEGCTSLKELPKEMKDMKSLVFLNLRECTSLSSLPDIKMDSLKVLILSGCSKLEKFQVVSEKLETLNLDGTSINELPSDIGNLHGLMFLNMKDCNNLVTLPNCLGEMTSLQELKLSRCSKLKKFPDVKKNLVNLRILLLDGTSLKEMPKAINGSFLSFLQRLCLSRNDEIQNVQFNTSHRLRWLELKYCMNLTTLQLPPNLQCLDAHGCASLRTVTSSLDIPRPTENIHSTLIFTNCNKLEQVSKNVIISYVQKKGQLMSDDRYNRDFVFNSLIGTCFPGCEVPMWFNHRAVGSVLKPKLPRDWRQGRLNGVALCVVVSFEGFTYQTNSLQVKCTCEYDDHANIKLRRESFIVGGWSELGDDEPKKIESDHVFIGCTSWFNTKKRQEEEHEENEYVPTEISLSFEVTNGTSEVAECKVMKCGISLLYESDVAVSWEARLDAIPSLEDNKHDETTSTIASVHEAGESSRVLINGE